MGNIVANQGLARVGELFNRVGGNDPANAILVVALLASTGLETDAVLKDKDTMVDVVSGTTNESTNAGYARKPLDQTAVVVFAPDDTLDRWIGDIPDQTWVNVANDGTGAIGKFVVLYDSDSTTGTDTNVVPLTFHDFVVTPDGSNITAQISATGFIMAQ